MTSAILLAFIIYSIYKGEWNLKNIFLSGQLMYFGVKLRDFEGFLIPVRKPPRQLIFSKFYKIFNTRL